MLTLRGTAIASALAVAALGGPFATKPADAHHIREGDVRFKVTCEFSHSLTDDPIVYPNQPGASHLHDFIGRRGVDASTTTYRQLTKSGGTSKERTGGGPAGLTTCNDAEDLAAYWVPALYVDGEKLDPTGMSAYYRRGDKHGTIKPYPNGLKLISDEGGWQCDATVVASPLDCSTELKMHVDFPDCWDGRNIDSFDHRSHMAYSADTGDANTCPASHPVPVPRLTMYVNYQPPVEKSQITLASGAAFDSRGVASTVHGDFFNGWVRARLIERIETCLNQLQRCDSGG